MVKKISLLLFAALIILPTKALATEGAINITPAYLDYSIAPDSSKNFKLQISNTSEQTLELELLAARLYKEDNGFKYEASNEHLSFPVTKSRLGPKGNVELEIIAKIGEEILTADYTPGVIVQFKQTGNGVVGVNQNLVVPVRITFTEKVRQSLSLAVTTVPAQVVTNQQFDVFGSIVNNQNRYVQPGASIQLREGPQFLGEWALTEILPEKLEPKVPLSFQYRVKGINLTPFHNYQVYLSINDSITKQSVVTSYSFIYIPAGMIFLFGALLAFIIAGTILTLIYRRRRRAFKIYRRI